MRRVLLVLMVSMAGWVLGVLLAKRAARDQQARRVLRDQPDRLEPWGPSVKPARRDLMDQSDRRDPQAWRGRAARRANGDHPVHQARREMWE